MQTHYFDNSIFSTPENTYHSYICESNDYYWTQDNNKVIQNNLANYHWNIPQETYFDSQPTHISNLRNILSETISDITKNNNLKKGESVQLTLEIELMKTANNTPSNSLVEVTIIQHSKTKKKYTDIEKKQTADRPLKLEACVVNKTASQKRRNWFDRIINRHCCENEENIKTKYQPQESCTQNVLKESLKSINNENKPNKSYQNNLMTILPNQIPHKSNSKKKVYKTMCPNNVNKIETIHNPKHVTDTKKHSLGKKISDIFLPRKISDKYKIPELTANKKDGVDINILKNNPGKKTIKNMLPSKKVEIPCININDTAIIHPALINNNLKNIGNIDCCEDENIVKENFKENPINPVKVHLESHSDTCCVKPIKDITTSIIKTSTSECNVRVNKDQASLTSSLVTEHLSEVTKNIYNVQNNLIHSQRGKKMTGVHNSPTAKMQKKKSKKRIKKKHVCSNKSLIQWNGHNVKINKQLKAKIEMMIVNELQNLAFKEGMECDITPIPSKENCTNSSENKIEKISSFMCQLDTNKEKCNNVLTHRKSSHSKVKAHQSSRIHTREIKTSKHTRHKKHCSGGKCNKKSEYFFRDPGDGKLNKCDNISTKKLCKSDAHSTIKKRSTSNLNGQGEPEQDFEVKYLNTNAQNWSAESCTVLAAEGPTSKPLEPPQVGSRAAPDNGNLPIISGFIKKIESNDPIWNDHLVKEKIIQVQKPVNICKDLLLEQTPKTLLEEEKQSIPFSIQFVTETNTQDNMKAVSSTSNEYGSNMEIELNVRDLELILEEVKRKKYVDKICITAQKTLKKPPPCFTGKNSPSYTEQLLLDASTKLKKYVRKRK